MTPKKRLVLIAFKELENTVLTVFMQNASIDQFLDTHWDIPAVFERQNNFIVERDWDWYLSSL